MDKINWRWKRPTGDGRLWWVAHSVWFNWVIYDLTEKNDEELQEVSVEKIYETAMARGVEKDWIDTYLKIATQRCGYERKGDIFYRLSDEEFEQREAKRRQESIEKDHESYTKVDKSV